MDNDKAAILAALKRLLPTEDDDGHRRQHTYRWPQPDGRERLQSTAGFTTVGEWLQKQHELGKS